MLFHLWPCRPAGSGGPAVGRQRRLALQPPPTDAPCATRRGLSAAAGGAELLLLHLVFESRRCVEPSAAGAHGRRTCADRKWERRSAWLRRACVAGVRNKVARARGLMAHVQLPGADQLLAARQVADAGEEQQFGDGLPAGSSFAMKARARRVIIRHFYLSVLSGGVEPARDARSRHKT
jgi:hypothetical protein